MNDPVNGRVALVTGASSGIGAATARSLAAAGMKVAVTARRAERLQALCSEIVGAGGQVLAVPADVRDEMQIEAVFEAVRARWGGVEVLVNNAGLGRDAPLLSGPTAAWREMFEVNVLALCVFTREAVADMRRLGDDGQVVHIGSMAGHRTPNGVSGAFYAATKNAVRGLTEGLRRELHAAGSGIRVSAISPGYVETEFAEVFSGDPAGAHAYTRFPCLQSEDIAALVLSVLRQPAHVQIHDVLVRPIRQPI